VAELRTAQGLFSPFAKPSAKLPFKTGRVNGQIRTGWLLSSDTQPGPWTWPRRAFMVVSMTEAEIVKLAKAGQSHWTSRPIPDSKKIQWS
jgi:hypothetical protein